MNCYIQQGEKFLRDCIFDGLAHSYDVIKKEYVKPYPEVTGYVIKYFCDHHMLINEMEEAGEYLISLQDEIGGWSSFYAQWNLYAFDTAQILIGLCALYQETKNKKYLESALQGGRFLKFMQMENGAFIPIYNRKLKQKDANKKIYDIWNGPFSGLMCKLTEAYDILYLLTQEKEFLLAKEKTADFYEKAEYIEYTHPMGYWLEGLYAAERYEKIEEVLTKHVLPDIRENGFIPYRKDLPYAYVSGSIQLGIILQKMGYRKEAELIKAYGRKVQACHVCGGLFQYADSQGALDKHVHTEINSWGTKYFCELERCLENE